MTASEIPASLAEAMKRGEAVLFLGAGASFGATRADGQIMPLGNALRDLVCDRFLAGTCKDRSLDEVATLAETTVGRAELDQFVANAVRGFEPTPAHLLLPKFRWKAVFGTNYDLLVEAGWVATPPLQTLKPIFRDTGIERELATVVDPLPYYKLHGTIDYLHDPAIPLILTQDSYLTYRQNRKRLFGRFEDLAREMPVVFVGTRLADHHLREILHAVDADASTRPTYFFVSPDINEFDVALLGRKRMLPIKATFEGFMAALDAAVEPLARTLYGAVAPAGHSIERHFRRNVACPPSIRAFLTDNVEHVHAGLSSTAVDAKLFFKGQSESWDPIERGYDIERQIYSTVMLRLLDLENAAGELNVVCVRGVAGAGKTVFARRLAYDLAVKHGPQDEHVDPGIAPPGHAVGWHGAGTGRAVPRLHPGQPPFLQFGNHAGSHLGIEGLTFVDGPGHDPHSFQTTAARPEWRGWAAGADRQSRQMRRAAPNGPKRSGGPAQPVAARRGGTTGP